MKQSLVVNNDELVGVEHNPLCRCRFANNVSEQIERFYLTVIDEVGTMHNGVFDHVCPEPDTVIDKN